MLLTTKELAEKLRVHQLTVRRMVADGRIPAKFVLKIGKQYRYNGPAIIEHMLKK